MYNRGMNLTLDASTLVVVFILMVVVLTMPASGKMSATEKLIANEVIRLGGDFESLNCPELLGFEGPQFNSEHYDFLSHLPTIRIFYVFDAIADAAAFQHIGDCPSLKEVQIKNPRSFDGVGLRCLARQRNLDKLLIEKAVISTEGIGELSQITSLRELVLDEVGLPEGHLIDLARLANLKKLHLSTQNVQSQDELAKLRVLLPNCEIHYSVEAADD